MDSVIEDMYNMWNLYSTYLVNNPNNVSLGGAAIYDMFNSNMSHIYIITLKTVSMRI